MNQRTLPRGWDAPPLRPAVYPWWLGRAFNSWTEGWTIAHYIDVPRHHPRTPHSSFPALCQRKQPHQSDEIVFGGRDLLVRFFTDVRGGSLPLPLHDAVAKRNVCPRLFMIPVISVRVEERVVHVGVGVHSFSLPRPWEAIHASELLQRPTVIFYSYFPTCAITAVVDRYSSARGRFWRAVHDI